MFQKLWFQHVWPCLQLEMKTQEVLAAVLEPVISLVQECTSEEYESIILPSFRYATCTCACVCVCVCALHNITGPQFVYSFIAHHLIALNCKLSPVAS